MRSRFLQELTTPELEAYLARGGKTALLPVGCTEMHGPHQPLGTDTFCAEAFALEIARLADGVVLPTVNYTWAGSTDGFAGTISIAPELVTQIVESVALKALRMGFSRFVVICIHSGHYAPLVLFARRFYEKHGVPAVYINPYQPFTDEASELFAGHYDGAKEASVVLASLRILGKDRLYAESEMAYHDEEPPWPDSQRAVGKVATVGYFMQDPRHHACPSEHVSMERGLRFIALQVQAILPALEQIDAYAADAEKQRNQGWWRQGDVPRSGDR